MDYTDPLTRFCLLILSIYMLISVVMCRYFVSLVGICSLRAKVVHHSFGLPKCLARVADIEKVINKYWRIPLMVQWLRLCTFNAGGPGLTPGQGTKIPT